MTTVLWPIVVVVVGGAMGGFLRGLTAKTEYTLAIPWSGKRVDMGFLGDCLSGAAGGLAIFLVAASLLQDNLGKLTQNSVASIQVLGLTVVAGFVGPQLLTSISRKIVGEELDRLNREMVQMEAKVQKMATRNESDNLVQVGEFHAGNHKYNTAIRLYEQALTVDPTNDHAMTRQAYAWKRIEFPRHVDKALSLVDRAIAINPRNDHAWYNRACYKAILKQPVDDVLADIQKAIELSPINREIASEDEDLKEFRSNPAFIELIKGAPAK
jgi:tetratricopeptide (TPR) repeat protein